MDVNDIHKQDIVQFRATVTSNEKDQWDLKEYISDVAIDIAALAPEKLQAFLIDNDRKNMALISVVAMSKDKCFGDGKNKRDLQRQADARWERRLKKKNSSGAGPSSG